MSVAVLSDGWKLFFMPIAHSSGLPPLSVQVTLAGAFQKLTRTTSLSLLFPDDTPLAQMRASVAMMAVSAEIVTPVRSMSPAPWTKWTPERLLPKEFRYVWKSATDAHSSGAGS